MSDLTTWVSIVIGLIGLATTLWAIAKPGQKKQRKRKIRYAELTKALDSAAMIRRINPDEFIAKLKAHPGIVPEAEAAWIRDMYLLRNYFKDNTESSEHISYLHTMLGSIQSGSNIGGAADELKKRLILFQQRINWMITEWENELSKIQ